MIKLKFGNQKRLQHSYGSLPIQMRLHRELEAKGYLVDATSKARIASLHALAEKVSCFPDSKKSQSEEQKLPNNVIVLGARYEGKDMYGYELVRNAKRAELVSKKSSLGRARNQRQTGMRSGDALTQISSNFKQAQN